MRVVESPIASLELTYEPERIIIIQRSGGGKSLSAESIIEEHHEYGKYIVIHLTDMKDEFEPCYAMFEPEMKYHLDKLRYEGKVPSKKKVKIYHPFTFDIPSKLLPKMELFTFPIKSLNRTRLSLISETHQSTDSVTLLLNAIRSLPKSGSIYDLVHNIERDIQTNVKKKFGGQIVKANKNFFFLRTGQKGSKTSVAQVGSWFEPFLYDYMLAPSNFKLNFDAKKLLQDQESYHCLVTKWIKDPKMKYFVMLSFFNEIIENIEYAKHPVLFVIEEVAKLVPQSPEGFKVFLAEYIRDELLTMRSQGRGCGAIMTSQGLDFDDMLKEKGSKMLIGQIVGINELARLAKSLKYGKDMVNKIKSLRRNQFIKYGDEKLDAFVVLFPSHCHAETVYNFIEMYSRHYPEKMRNYKDLKDEVKKHLKEIEQVFQKRCDEEDRQKEKELKEEQERASGKEKLRQELEDLKEKMKSESDMSKAEKIRKVWELKEKDSDISQAKIADIIGIDKSTVSRWLKLPKTK